MVIHQIAILATLLLGFPLVGHSAAAENGCVTCHASLAPSTHRAHDFAEWRGSVHAKSNVTCEQCHGGNPAVAEVKAAHTGVARSNKPESRLYFTRIPETCGACHTTQLGEFKRSFHYRELQRSGRGPNCTTCHGSMATTVPTAAQLEQQCSLCHDLRSAAGEAFATLNRAGAALKHWEEALGRAKEARVATPADAAALAEQQKVYRAVQGEWHALNMALVTSQARQIAATAAAATQALHLKSGGK